MSVTLLFFGELSYLGVKIFILWNFWSLELSDLLTHFISQHTLL